MKKRYEIRDYLLDGDKVLHLRLKHENDNNVVFVQIIANVLFNNEVRYRILWKDTEQEIFWGTVQCYI